MSGETIGTGSPSKMLVIVDVRILSDAECLHSEILRNSVPKEQQGSLTQDKFGALRNRTLRQGTELLLKAIHEYADVECKAVEISQEFLRLKKLLKPNIMVHFMVEQLQSQGVEVAAYSSYEDEVNKVLSEVVLPLYSDIKLVRLAELEELVGTQVKKGGQCTVLSAENLLEELGSFLGPGKSTSRSQSRVEVKYIYKCTIPPCGLCAFMNSTPSKHLFTRLDRLADISAADIGMDRKWRNLW